MESKNSKTVIVTGSSRGLGKSIIQLFSEKNYNVVINYKNNKESALELESKIKKINKNVIVVRADVSNRKQVKNLFQKTLSRFGQIDILVNNAGINRRGFFEDITDDDWDDILSNNLKSVFICCQEVFKHMKKRGGNIINISSAASQYHGPKTVHYAVSKAGVNSLTKVVARYGAKYNILVNAIAPGVILTDQTYDEVNSPDGKKIPRYDIAKKFGKPTDVSSACLFLASEDQNYITGQILSVSGGAYLG